MKCQACGNLNCEEDCFNINIANFNASKSWVINPEIKNIWKGIGNQNTKELKIFKIDKVYFKTLLLCLNRINIHIDDLHKIIYSYLICDKIGDNIFYLINYKFMGHNSIFVINPQNSMCYLSNKLTDFANNIVKRHFIYHYTPQKSNLYYISLVNFFIT